MPREDRCGQGEDAQRPQTGTLAGNEFSLTSVVTKSLKEGRLFEYALHC